MNKVFFIADTHFGDNDVFLMSGENKFFDSVKDKDEEIIKNWNTTVSPEDIVFILGDFGDMDYWYKLNGKKTLIKGNHDNYVGQRDYDECFEGIYDYLQLTEDKTQIILSHYPIWDWAGMYYGSYHLYGHIHDKTMPHEYNAYCVSVEHIDYEPVTLEEIIKEKLEN